MRPNPLKSSFETGTISLGAWITTSSSIIAEIASSSGYDYVCLDMQHGLMDYSDTVPMLQALTTGTATPVVRVPENHPSHIGKALDAGAMGIIIPMINTVEQCEAAVAACRYAPKGSRSYGPSRVIGVEGADYFQRANADISVIPMIETVEALGNLDAILSVPGVNAIYVGPADLAISQGFEPGTSEPEFLEALSIVVAACDRHNVVPGMHATPTTANDRLNRGFRMVTVTADLVALRTKLNDDLAFVRDGGEHPSDDSMY
jgi:4-hydroxy-2-oxoheptanedioate aldolase